MGEVCRGCHAAQIVVLDAFWSFVFNEYRFSFESSGRQRDFIDRSPLTSVYSTTRPDSLIDFGAAKPFTYLLAYCVWPLTSVQVLSTCPGLRLSQALYDVTRQQRHHKSSLSLGVIVTSLRRDGVMTSLTDCRRHRDVTAACQRLWRRYDVSTWRLREPQSTWSVSSFIARSSTQCNNFPDLILHNAPLWRHHNNERDVNNDACPECSLQLIIISY